MIYPTKNPHTFQKNKLVIYVIGVDHKREQYPHSMNDVAKIECLKSTLRDLHKSENIGLIAEEWCDDARRAWSASTTYAEDVAAELGIKHLACDPGISERASLDLKTRGQIAQELGLDIFSIQENSEEEIIVNDAARNIDQKRERYWLDRIIESGFADKNIVLVCGYGHVNSFIVLARSLGYEAEKV